MVVHKVLRQLILLAQRPEGERTSRNVLEATDIFPETNVFWEKNVYFLLSIYYCYFFFFYPITPTPIQYTEENELPIYYYFFFLIL